ncbi:unnamed protein product [Agarophyton chilense]
MASASERLKELKKTLLKAREENIKAVDYEERQQENDRQPFASQDANHCPSTHRKESSKDNLKRRSNGNEKDDGIGSADEAEGENNDERLRSMKRRAKAMENTFRNDTPKERNEESEVIAYGSVTDTKEGVDRVVNEIETIERRRAKYRRRRTFDEDRTDISFINEGNRIFNRTLDKHFDKFESVQKIKDSLERGTAQ